MADNSLRSALTRLFSNSVVVRKSAKDGRLKVTDTSKIQAINQDFGTDKYLRTFKSSLATYHQDQLNGFSAKRESLYRDYDGMDSDPIIASALDIYADESTTRNESGDILQISTTNDNIKDTLDNLFFDILNVEFNLWPWIRNLVKYGDFFLKLNVSEKYGIINVEPFSPLDIDRVEGVDPENPYEVKYLDRNIRNVEYENYEVAHFRLLSDSNYLPYGKSMIENARRIYKQLQLMEDAMMIHRIMRAPSKRVFKIDIGNIPPNEVENYMTQIINKMKKEPHIDRETGDYNLRYNLMNMIEDIFLPVRGQNSNTEIEEMSGLNYDGTEDIEYLKNKMLSALKIPKAYLGYEEDMNGKATLAQEDIRFARTIERIQRIVESELTKIAMVHLYAQGITDDELVNFSITLNNPSTIYTREQLELYSTKMNLIRDIKDLKMVSSDWIYENILELPVDQVETEREKIVDDMKRSFRYMTIENEGNDPEDPNTPNEGGGEMDSWSADYDGDGDMDNLPPLNPPQRNESEKGGLPTDKKGKQVYTRKEYEEFGRTGGRPKHTSRYEKDDYVFGRDPIGRKQLSRSDENFLKKMKNDMNISTKTMLSEENIIDDNN